MKTNNKTISVVITARLTDTLFEAGDRLRSVCDIVPKEDFEVVIVDYGTPRKNQGVLENVVSPNVRVVKHPAPRDVFSIGDARDYGAQVARGAVVFFLDIDFHAPSSVFRSLFQLVQEKRMFDYTRDFLCVPVLFLTPSGTVAYENGMENGKHLAIEANPSAIEADKETVEFPSYGSSAMVVNRNHYLAIGGHHDAFSGHGAEDFEFLHRLSSLAPWGDRPADYYTDTRSKTYEPLSGFRSYFARYAKAALDRGIFLVHRHHPKRTERGYFRRRQNFRKLSRLMKAYDRNNVLPLPLRNLACAEHLIAFIDKADPDFDSFRPTLSTFRSYELLPEGRSMTEGALDAIFTRRRPTAILLRDADDSYRRRLIRRRASKFGLMILIG